MPELPDTTCNEIYKTIIIKNTGIMNFAKGTVLRNLENKWAQNVLIPVLEVGKETTIVARINNLKQVPGKYQSKYVVIMKNEENVEEQIGEVVLNYEIFEKKNEYSKVVMEKAQKLKDIFGEKDLEFYCEVVKAGESLTIEDLIENLLVKSC